MEEEKSFLKQVADIQLKLKANKGQYNKFGDYYYRSCEDILEAVKPLLGNIVLTIGDEIVPVNDQIYIKATATLYAPPVFMVNDSELQKIHGEKLSVSAYARETMVRPKFDSAQLTGSASSYARKYALNGLFLIDDTKDPDHTNNGQGNVQKNVQVNQVERSQGQRKTIQPSDKQKKFYFELLTEFYGSKENIPSEDLEDAKKMDIAAMSKAINELKIELGK